MITAEQFKATGPSTNTYVAYLFWEPDPTPSDNQTLTQLSTPTPRQKKLHTRPKRGESVKQEPKAIESTVLIKQEPTTAHKRQRSSGSTITGSLAKRLAGVITRRQARQGLQEQEQDEGQGQG